MQLLTPADVAGRVTTALKSAAQATGAGFDYLLRTAQRESSLDPTAKAPTSSARGLFQFIDQTWLGVLKEEGPALGLGAAAADISRSASGRYSVADPTRRAELLAMRDDPQSAALLAGAFTRRNAETLQSALGRPATEGELYAAHFLGAKGAVSLIRSAAENPNGSAAEAFPAQASANRAIFYDKGRPRSLSEVYAKITSGHDAPATVASTALALQSTGDEADYGPFNNGVENDGQAFHSLFKTGRRTPVAAYVTQTWSSFGSAGLTADVAPSKVAALSAAPAAPATVSASQRATEPARATAVATAAVRSDRTSQPATEAARAATSAASPTFKKINLSAPTPVSSPRISPR